MKTTITVDRSGRILLPKSVRELLGLMPGDELELQIDGNSMSLRPVRAAGGSAVTGESPGRKGGLVVFPGRVK